MGVGGIRVGHSLKSVNALNPESSPLITSAEAVITGHIEHANN